MAGCDVCGFEYGGPNAEEIPDRLRYGVAAIGRLLEAEPAAAAVRAQPERWSPLEYAAHVRDVLLTIRDRSVVGLVDDDPGFMPMHREERIELDLYRHDTVAAIVPELEAAAAMYLRLFVTLDEDQRARPVRYGHPDPSPRTVGWMAEQAVHEVEHHLVDIETDLVRQP